MNLAIFIPVRRERGDITTARDILLSRDICPVRLAKAGGLKILPPLTRYCLGWLPEVYQVDTEEKLPLPKPMKLPVILEVFSREVKAWEAAVVRVDSRALRVGGENAVAAELLAASNPSRGRCLEYL